MVKTSCRCLCVSVSKDKTYKYIARRKHPVSFTNKRPKGPHIVHLSTICHLFEESAKANIFVYWLARKTQTSQRPLPSLCFSGRREKQDGRPGLWLAETFSTSPLKPLNWIQRNLTGSKISTSSTKFVFFGPIRKTRWPHWPLIGWDIFDFSSETTELNSTKLDRKQDLNVLYQVCVFRADRKNKMAALASDWLRHFRLLRWNHWTEFNETWQEARSQRPLPSLCFSGRSEKQDGRPGLWLAETFSTSPLKLLNWIQRNLTGSKISTSSTKFVFLGPIGKTRWPPWPLIGWDIFDFSSETAEWNSTKLDRKQDLNVLYQVCVFRADRKNKMATLASDWLRHFRLLLWNYWTEFNETWQEARSQRPLPSLCFWGRSEKQDGRPGLWLAETFSTSPLKPLNGIQRNLTGSKISTSSTKFVFFGPIRKTRWPPWPLIGWDIFDFSAENAEWNSTKLDRKQDGRGRWDLASCQVSLNSIQRFQRRSRKCLSQSEARAAILFFRSAPKTQTW